MTMGVAIDLIATHQQHCNRWTLYCHGISVVAIGGTLYCHDKYLVARGSPSIATLNIVVAIGGTLYCHDKCLVARGCLSIATINTWLPYLDSLLPRSILGCYTQNLYCHDYYCVSIVWILLPCPPFHWFEVFCYIVCLLLQHILQHQMITPMAYIATLCLVTSNNNCTLNNI